nr:COMM domain-containing protein 1 isoform X2 [Macaca nemestrina]
MIMLGTVAYACNPSTLGGQGECFTSSCPTTTEASNGQPWNNFKQSIASADMDFNQLEAFLTAQTKKQGGITSDQAAVISKFWKSHKTKIRESLMNQSRWNSGLRGLSWRVDGKSQSRHSAQIHTPVAIIELELGKYGQVYHAHSLPALHLLTLVFLLASDLSHHFKPY